MATNKKHSILCILLFFLPVLLVGSVTYIVDPFQIYRPQHMVKPMFFSDQRYQNAGKINSYLTQGGYDAVIIGHSQTDNFLPAQVAEYLGWKQAIKLTINGGKPIEQALVLERAFSKGNIRHVFWGIGTNYLSYNARVWNPKKEFPAFFYTDTLFDDGKYLFSLDSFTKSLNLLTGNLDDAWMADLEELNYWMPNRVKGYLNFTKPSNLRKLSRQRDKDQAKREKKIHRESDRSSFPSVDENLIPIFRKYPDVRFVIYFPPIFRGTLPEKIIAYARLQQYIVQRCSHYRNVEFYGFSNLDRITANAANFRDIMHYHSGVNLFMLRKIANKEQKLTLANIDDYFHQIVMLTVKYKIAYSYKNMIPMMKEEERKEFKKLLHRQRKKESKKYAKMRKS